MKPTAFAATEINLNEILDLDRYPIHAIGDAARTELVLSLIHISEPTRPY